MEQFLNFITSNIYLLLVITLALILCILVISFARNYTSKRKEIKLQNNPQTIYSHYVGSFFKVIEVKDNIIKLALNPSIQNPLGDEKIWFKIDGIPKELRKEDSVIKVVNKLDGEGITFVAWPIF